VGIRSALAATASIAALLALPAVADAQVQRHCRPVAAGNLKATSVSAFNMSCRSTRAKLRRWLGRDRLPRNPDGWYCRRSGVPGVNRQCITYATESGDPKGFSFWLRRTASSAQAAYKPCSPVVNPYAGSRYEGSDLYRIRALDISCSTARRVVRRGHYKALADVPDASGFVYVTYRRWRITGDLRGATDRYVAKARGGKRVRWLF
jgi:hypothetical protein